MKKPIKIPMSNGVILSNKEPKKIPMPSIAKTPK